ncbi:carboxypeptidase N subunit 2-like [Littorina saxatilis]|uniref:carboxypeptidase N subunit 2-like n=1 Tax=Littorina saxatilis TaxID=31220 RepID=UPI0038B55605
MTRWQRYSKIHRVLFLATVAMVTMLSLAAPVEGCPKPCRCSQRYYVYCQSAGLTFETLREVVTFVPYEAILLDLSSNAVGQIPSGTLDSVPNLEYLFLADNEVKFLGVSVFHYLQQLKELTLCNNRLKEIGVNIFVNMSNLKKLQLDGNLVESIKDRAFSLPKLHTLHLQNNKLTVIRPHQLYGLSALEYLDLSDNLIHTLELGAFQDLSNLHKLRLSRNKLSSLAENVFEGLSSLSELYMDDNMLPSLDCFDVPNFANTLQRLMLTDNSLVAVPHDVFSQLKNLRTLALDHNQISHVGRQAFSGLQLDNLTLAYNLLEIVDREMFEGARRISSLDLSHNRIHTIKTGAFDSFRESVYVLDLSDNKLATLDHGMFRGMRNLQTLNLSSNALWSILDGTFREVTLLGNLDLDHNELQWLSADLLEGPSLQRLSVLDNPIKELRGFTFEDESSHPVNILVNLTLTSSTVSSVTVTWPYRRGAQLYWKLKVWCVVSDTDRRGRDPLCGHSDTPLIEASIPPNRVSETVSGLTHGREYFVCVNPTFLTPSVEVRQCGVVSTLAHPKTTVTPVSQGSQAFNAGSHPSVGSAVLCSWCVVAVMMLVTGVCAAWLDVLSTLLISLTRTRQFAVWDSVSVCGTGR